MNTNNTTTDNNNIESKLDEIIQLHDRIIEDLILEYECWKMLAAFYNGDDECFSRKIYTDVINQIFKKLADPSSLTICEMLTIIMYQIETDTFNEGIPLLLNLLSQAYDIEIQEETRYKDFQTLRGCIGQILLDIPMPSILNMLSDFKNKPSLSKEVENYCKQIKFDDQTKSTYRDLILQDDVMLKQLHILKILNISLHSQVPSEVQSESSDTTYFQNGDNSDKQVVINGQVMDKIAEIRISDFAITEQRSITNSNKEKTTEAVEEISETPSDIPNTTQTSNHAPSDQANSSTKEQQIDADSNKSPKQKKPDHPNPRRNPKRKSGNEETSQTESEVLSSQPQNDKATSSSSLPSRSPKRRKLLPIVTEPQEITPITTRTSLNTSLLKANHIKRFAEMQKKSQPPAPTKRKRSQSKTRYNSIPLHRSSRNNTSRKSPTKRVESSVSDDDFSNEFLNAKKLKIKRRESPRRRDKTMDGVKKRVKWSLREEDILVIGVKKYGVSHWKEILMKGPLPQRSVRDCYDKWKNINKYNHLAIIEDRISRRK